MREKNVTNIYVDGLKEATDDNVEVNTSEDQVDRLEELKENMKLFNWIKIIKKYKNFFMFLIF